MLRLRHSVLALSAAMALTGGLALLGAIPAVAVHVPQVTHGATGDARVGWGLASGTRAGLGLSGGSAQRPDLSTAQNQPLLCHALRLEGRTPLLPPGCPRIPARHGDVHRQRRCSTVSAAERSRPRRRPTGRTHLPSFSSSKGRLKNLTLSERSHLHQTARGPGIRKDRSLLLSMPTAFDKTRGTSNRYCRGSPPGMTTHRDLVLILSFPRTPSGLKIETLGRVWINRDRSIGGFRARQTVGHRLSATI
jgi:hypothetical protein